MSAEWWLVILGVVLTAGTAVFVAAEFSLVTLDPGVIDRDPQMGDRRGRSVRRALHHLSTELSGAQVGITITTILLGYTTQPALSSLLTGWLGEEWLGSATAAVIGAVAILAVNGFSMIFGELVPKNAAIARPLGTARTVAPLQRGFTAALRPLIVAFNNSANALLRRVGIEPREELSGGRSAQELSALVRRSAQAGTLEASTARLVTNSIEFGELTAVDVMTDRTRMASIERHATAADVVATARATGHSRFPVTDGSTDDVVGIVQLRQAVSVPFERRAEVPAAALMVDAPRVPETGSLPLEPFCPRRVHPTTPATGWYALPSPVPDVVGHAAPNRAHLFRSHRDAASTDNRGTQQQCVSTANARRGGRMS